MTRTFLFFILAIFILSSCGGYSNKPKIDHDEANLKTDTLMIKDIVSDTSRILIADLPVYFDSTEVLLFPIGLVDLEKLNKRPSEKGFSSSRSYSSSEDISGAVVYNSSNDFISGSITNIVFENLKTNEQHLLSHKALNISSVEYLRDLAKKTKKDYLLYQIYDKDTNKDGELNNEDVQSLYISRLDGTRFEKAMGSNEEFDQGRMVLLALKYYFRTIEDSNKDGFFDKNDKFHYYYIDFSGDDFKIVKYDLMSLLK